MIPNSQNNLEKKEQRPKLKVSYSLILNYYKAMLIKTNMVLVHNTI